jgi:hypothetical protein
MTAAMQRLVEAARAERAQHRQARAEVARATGQEALRLRLEKRRQSYLDGSLGQGQFGYDDLPCECSQCVSAIMLCDPSLHCENGRPANYVFRT